MSDGETSLRYLISMILIFAFTVPLIAQDATTSDNQPHNISQTQDGVIVTLDQSYADAKQIVVWFTISGLDLPDGRLMGAPILDVIPVLADYPSSAIGGMGGQVDFEDDGTIKANYVFDLETDVGEFLELAVEVRLGQGEGMPLYLVPDGVPNEESINEDYAYELPYDLFFSFPLILEPTPAQMIVTNFSDTSNELTLTIDKITLTPIFAEVPICFDVPDASDWQPVITLTINGEDAVLSGFSLDGLPDLETSSRCSTFDFRLEGAEMIETIEITIDGYQASIPELIDAGRIARAQEYLSEQGIVVQYNQANITLIEYPNTVTESEAYKIAYDALRDRYDAQWTFSLNVDGE